MRNCKEMLSKRWTEGHYLCVGLDTTPVKIPSGFHGGTSSQMTGFNWMVMGATSDIAAAYKLNLWFYLAHGIEGMDALMRTCQMLRTEAPQVPIILDGKFGDVPDTTNEIVELAFKKCKVDAVTVNPYLGHKAVASLFADPDKMGFVLCHTSNDGAGEFQNLDLYVADGPRLFEQVAMNVAEQWNQNNNCGLVTGATYLSHMKLVREAAPDLTLLIPGIGKQKGDLKGTIEASRLNEKRGGAIINASRSIIYAPYNWEEQAPKDTIRAAALKLSDEITAYMTQA